MRTIFKQEYYGDSLCDVYRDVSEALDETYNPKIRDIPVDEHGVSKGTFTVTITWSPE